MAWISLWLDRLLQDARYALRTLRRNRGFSAVVVLTLALGISMTTAVFSVFNAVVLRPVVYPNPERLVWLSTIQNEGETGIVLGPDFVDWRAQATSFDGMVAYGTWDATVRTRAGSARVRLANVTEDFEDVMGVRPAAGRWPRADERDAVVLSHAFAQQWFPADADAIGTAVTIEGRQATVVGVLPEHFPFHLPASPWPGFRPKAIDIYQPVFISPLREGMVEMFNVVGRLKPGVTLDQARAELQGIRARVMQEHPNPYRSEDQRMLRIVLLHDQLVGGARLGLWVLLTAVGFVLLIASANAASLLLARASTRHNEIAIRVSLGAARFRVLQQCLMESLILALMACGAGLLMARLAVTAIMRLGPQAVPRLAESAIDGRAFAVALGLALLTAVGFGLAPALALWKLDAHDALQHGAKGASRHVTPMRARSSLLGAEIALALVLLIGAGLMLKSAWRLGAHPPGFEPERILTMKVVFTDDGFRESPLRQLAFVDALLDRFTVQPGVEAASVSTHGYSSTEHLFVEGAPQAPADEREPREPIFINATSAALSRVMGLRMVRGQWITDNEPVAVINERLARREFPKQDPIGRRIKLDESGAFMTIVGIVADLRYSRLDAAPEPEVYIPYSQADGIFGFNALIRTTGEPHNLAAAIRPLVSSIDQGLVAEDVMTLEQALAETIAPRRWNLFLLTTFATCALALALIGMYGLMTYWVNQRQREIGMRMALGARPGEVVEMVVRQGMRITLAGIVVGVLGALALTRVMSSLLYDVQPRDLQTFVVVTIALTATAFAACCLPALKAVHVDPAIVLRHD